MAAAQKAPSVYGLILVATPGRRLGDVIKDQLRSNPANAPFINEADRAIDTLAAGERVDTDTMPAPLTSLFAPAVQGFLISAFALDPAKLANSVAKPILILQGNSDLQVRMQDADLLSAAAPQARLVRLSDVNHVLKFAAPDDAAANLATYADPTLPLASGVTGAIVEFISRTTMRTDTE